LKETGMSVWSVVNRTLKKKLNREEGWTFTTSTRQETT